MAETVVWNKKLLSVSLILGVVAMILFYSYESLQQAKVRRNVVSVLKWKVDRRIGDEVSGKDVDVAQIPRESFEALDGVAQDTPQNRDTTIGYHLGRDVERGDFVRLADILENQKKLPSARIKVGGYRAFPLRVDPYNTVGDLLRVDDKVGLIGLVSVGGKPPRAYVLIDNLRVLAVGGRSETPEEKFRKRGRQRQEPSMRVYRTLAVEVQEETAVQLAELLPRIQGKIWVVLRNRKEPNKPTDGKINGKLLPVLDEPMPDSVDLRPG